MLNKMNEGELKVIKKLEMTVTVHDNCYSKCQECVFENNSNYWDNPREILKKCGCDIIEM